MFFQGGVATKVRNGVTFDWTVNPASEPRTDLSCFNSRLVQRKRVRVLRQAMDYQDERWMDPKTVVLVLA